MDNVIFIKKFLNPEGHKHCISGSKVKAILGKVQILPVGGVALGGVCACISFGLLGKIPFVLNLES